MKTDLFQSCGHCWVFQICWHIKCSTFTTSSFRIWNSSTGIPSPTLALFIVILSKAHLTFYSKMSSSRWVITASWLSWSRRSFLYSSSLYSCHLFLISSASIRSEISNGMQKKKGSNSKLKLCSFPNLLHALFPIKLSERNFPQHYCWALLLGLPLRLTIVPTYWY